MSQFVNFNKRGFTLPSGCKDLIDLLRPPRKRRKPKRIREAFPQIEIHKEHIPVGSLEQIQRFARMMLHSRAEAFVVEITAKAIECPLVLYHSNTERATGLALTTSQAPRREAISAFFAARSAEPLVGSGHEGMTTVVYPLPSDAAQIAALLTELLQEVYALGADAGLEVSYHEIERTR